MKIVYTYILAALWNCPASFTDPLVPQNEQNALHPGRQMWHAVTVVDIHIYLQILICTQKIDPGNRHRKAIPEVLKVMIIDDRACHGKEQGIPGCHGNVHGRS